MRYFASTKYIERMTDLELMERIAKKDAISFRELYVRYHKPLSGWANSRLRNWDATADLMQEFWADVWISPQLIRTDDAGICRNSLMKNVSFRILRYFHKQYNLLEIADDNLISERMAQLSYTHIDEEINAKEIQQFIDNLLEEMPVLARRIVELRLYQNMSVKETASTLKVAESTVSNNLSSVLSTLRHEVTLMCDTGHTDKLKVLLPLLIWLLGE
jgi:RNA polymerase sigma-70 factor (ECF subfamily)